MEIKKATEGNELGAGMKRGNSRKMHLVSYNRYAYNGIQQYRMVKGKLAHQMFALCCHSNWKDQQTLIEHLVH